MWERQTENRNSEPKSGELSTTNKTLITVHGFRVKISKPNLLDTVWPPCGCFIVTRYCVACLVLLRDLHFIRGLNCSDVLIYKLGFYLRRRLSGSSQTLRECDPFVFTIFEKLKFCLSAPSRSDRLMTFNFRNIQVNLHTFMYHNIILHGNM